jgi:glucose-1-phosphate cytidylyltransferase
VKVAIFAGGFGTRLSEETTIRPKPMVEIGGRPVLWHIMKMYAHHGFREFVILGGYRVDVIRDYFLNYRGRVSDYTIDLRSGEMQWHGNGIEDWKVTVLDTGSDTMTGGRLLRAREHLGNDTFCLTYGDGVSDVDLTGVLEHHRRSNMLCTLTAVVQPGRYGVLRLQKTSSRVEGFREKGATDGGLINGGFFVCEPGVFDLIDGDDAVWEQEPMERMVQQGRLGAYRHEGYWQSMDSLRDRMVLEEAWSKGAPWKHWAD